MGFASSDVDDEDLMDTQAEATAPNPNQDVAQMITPTTADADWSPQELEDFANWADICCEHYGVADIHKQDIIDKSSQSTHRLLIALFAKVTASDIDRSSAIVAAFPKSSVYKNQVVPRIQATILSPALKFYVRGLTGRLVRHIQLNPSAYGIPREVQDSYMYQTGFRLDIGKTCSSFRGELKRKIDESIEEKEDLYTLTRKLCSTHVEATSELADRVALLRSYMRRWIATPSTSDAPRPNWWTFMDTKCDKLWAPRKDESVQQHQSRIQKAFSGAVRDDLSTFPPNKQVKHLRRGVRLTQWQLNVAAAVQEMQKVEIASEPADAASDEAAEA